MRIARTRMWLAGTVSALTVAAAVPLGWAATDRDPAPAAATNAPEPAVEIIPTAYPVPAGAVFVATTGSDSNPGTETSPLRTLSAAVSRAPAGGTIVFRGGEYRLPHKELFKKLTLQPYPGEKAWFKGSTVVASSRFVADGTSWRLDNWNPSLVCKPTADGTPCVNEPGIVLDNPIAADPELVFLDGTPLTQVANRSAVTAGTFYRDTVDNRIYLGSSPAGHRVEIATNDYALHFMAGSDGSTVRGLGFVHYATAQNYTKRPGALISQAHGVRFEKNTIAHNAALGILLGAPSGSFGQDVVVTGNLFVRNGFNAVIAHRNERLTIAGNTIHTNNTERFGLSKGNALAGAGIKATYLRSATIRDNTFEANVGTGFWCDLSCYRVTVVRNLFRGNVKHGVYYEVSAYGLIASNVTAHNGGYGLKVSGSNHVKAYHNTHYADRQAILVAEDPRPAGDCANPNNCPKADDTALGITWDTRDVTVVNNLVLAKDAATAPLFDTVDGNPVGSAKRVGAGGMIPAAQMDHNGYYRTSGSAPGTLVKWVGTTSGGDVGYSSLAGFQGTGRDSHGRYQSGGAVYLVDGPGGDYRVIGGSPAETGGKPLPSDVAAAIGVPAGEVVAMGALAWPDRATGPAPSPSPSPAMASSLYRLHHAERGEVLLTISATEAQNATRYGYVSDGVVCRVGSRTGTGVVAVHRLVNHGSGDRLYTTSTAERDSAVSRYGYTSEGVGFYAATTSGAGLVPMHRLQRGGIHLFVVGDTARDTAVGAGWTYEKVAFHAAP
ncbi:MAG: right-handed parallel beta-helix repeat-containing protein [Micromonosporaceae bacterium]